MDYIRKVKKFNKIIKYGVFSILSLVVDTAVFLILLNFFSVELLIANTIAMCVGFIVQFVLASRKVFEVDINFKTLSVYILTTLLGFGIANLTLSISYYYIFTGQELISKMFSIVVPFFVMYYLRIYIFDKWFKKNNQYNDYEELNGGEL